MRLVKGEGSVLDVEEGSVMVWWSVRGDFGMKSQLVFGSRPRWDALGSCQDGGMDEIRLKGPECTPFGICAPRSDWACNTRNCVPGLNTLLLADGEISQARWKSSPKMCGKSILHFEFCDVLLRRSKGWSTSLSWWSLQSFSSKIARLSRWVVANQAEVDVFSFSSRG